MNYNEFCRILKTELPLNRKEKFFTGTVLPALLFHKGVVNFYTFLKLIRNLPDEISESSTGDSFLFYTEYNLKGSAGERNVGRRIPAETNDTPDVIIQILKPARVLIVIEAKMFENTTTSRISAQIKRQKKYVSDLIKSALEIKEEHVYHVALVPRKSGVSETNLFQVIHWDVFLKDSFRGLEECYFYNFLRFALENYEDLVSIRTGPDTKGLEVYRLAKQGLPFWVGRDGGAESVDLDGRQGTWASRDYYTRETKPKGGRKDNWIKSDQFAAIIDKYVKQSEIE